MIALIILSFIWLGIETHWLTIRLPYGAVPSIFTPLISVVDSLPWADTDTEAENIVAALAEEPTAFWDSLTHLKTQVEYELGNRHLPYHGRAHNRFPEYNTKKLYAMWEVYARAIGEI